MVELTSSLPAGRPLLPVVCCCFGGLSVARLSSLEATALTPPLAVPLGFAAGLLVAVRRSTLATV